MPNDGRNLLTNSRISAFSACPRRHQIGYELGIRRSRTTQPLRMGGAFHVGLDMMARGVELDDAIVHALDGYSTVPPWITSDEEMLEWKCEVETVFRLLHAYSARWSLPGFTVVQSETPFNIPILNPTTGRPIRTFRLAGVIDKIVRLDDGRLAIMEHKTTVDAIEPESEYWSRLRMNGQITTYLHAARRMGFDCETILYDVCRKPSIRPRKLTEAERRRLESSGMWFNEPAPTDAERETSAMYGARLSADIAARPEFYFARQTVARLDHELAEFERDVWGQAEAVRHARTIGVWPKNPSACLAPFRCEFADLCLNGWKPDGGGSVPDGFETVQHVHPEIAARGQLK